MKLQRIKIDDDVVEVDGVRVKGVRALQYTRIAGEHPVLNLQVAAVDSAIESDAFVNVSEAPADVDAVTEFLSRVNPRDLEDAVLAKMDWSSAGNGELTLEVLKEWAGASTP